MSLNTEQSDTSGEPLRQDYQGACEMHLHSDVPGTPAPAAITCHFDGLDEDYTALLDTGSTYCVMREDIARELHLIEANGAPGEEKVKIITRRGDFFGPMRRHGIRIPATEGANLELDTSWVILEGWPGPNVLGWITFLEAITFGCNPGFTADIMPKFYFAEAASRDDGEPLR